MRLMRKLLCVVSRTTILQMGNLLPEQVRNDVAWGDVIEALAGEIGGCVGGLEERIGALEEENRKLRTDLEILRAGNVEAIRKTAP